MSQQLHPLRVRHSTPDNTPYSYHHGEMFEPGNGIHVFDPGYLPPVQGLIGAATEIAAAPNPFQPPPIVMSPAALVAGQPTILGEWEFTPLMETTY